MSTFRERRDEGERSDSDDDLPPPRRSRLEESNGGQLDIRSVMAPRDSRSMWTDVALEQSLTVQLSSGSGVTNSAKCKRGAESYELPQFSGTPPLQEKQPVVCVSAAVDDPFADAFEPVVEEMGVKRSTYTDAPLVSVTAPRGRGHFRGRGRGSRMARGGGRQGEQHGLKRKWQSSNGGKTKFAAVSEGYSLETLMAVDFPEGISLTDLGGRMATALGEVKQDMVIKAVELMGEETASRLFNETREVEASGGLMVNDGTRRRTPGGVFLLLVRSDMGVSQEIKDKIFVDNANRVKKQAFNRPVRDHIVQATEKMSVLPEASEVLLRDGVVSEKMDHV